MKKVIDAMVAWEKKYMSEVLPEYQWTELAEEIRVILRPTLPTNTPHHPKCLFRVSNAEDCTECKEWKRHDEKSDPGSIGALS